MLRKRLKASAEAGQQATPPTASQVTGDEKGKAGKKPVSADLQKQQDLADKHLETLAPPSAEQGPIREKTTDEMIPIGRVILDSTNSRTRHILPGNPTHNKLSPDHPDYEENQQTIDGLIEFAANLKLEPLLQRISVYNDQGKYRILWGNRRYLAMKIAFGDQYQIPAKVYAKIPKNPKGLRFIENNQREDLSLLAKLLDFNEAQEELKQKRGNLNIRDAAHHLGIGKTTYSEYSNICACLPVFECLQSGDIRLKETALQIAKLKKPEAIKAAIETIKKEGEQAWNPDVKPKSSRTKPTTQSKGRPRTNIKVPPLKNPDVVKTMLEGGLLKRYDWSKVDWSNLNAVQEKLEECLTSLADEMQG